MPSNAGASGSAAIRRLEGWLAAGHTVPRLRGRVNRAALCRLVGLTRSTLDSNPGLRALIASLDLEIDPPPPPATHEATPLAAMEEELAALREENADLKRQLMSVAWLLSTGRSVRP